jgi:calpain-7
MQALKLSSNPQEKKQMKAQCGIIMDVAGRIKNDENWLPSVAPQRTRTKSEQIGQWAADVAVEATISAPASTVFEDTVSQSSRVELSSSTAPVDNVSAPSGKLSTSSFSFNTQEKCKQLPKFPANFVYDSQVLLIDLSDGLLHSSSNIKPGAVTDARHEDSLDTKFGETTDAQVLPPDGVLREPLMHTTPVPRPSQSVSKETASTAPSLASYQHIRRLAEPVSTRKRSKREDIILLKASVVNGFKCPPWEGNPPPSEFAPQPGGELFVYLTSSLAHYLVN